jgi:pimeloyl-ACP methyl ester carboxylesterase
VVELADALQVEKFGVVGWSAGGPYAAVCAARIPARLTGVGIVCSRHLSQFSVAENPSAEEELEADDREMFELVQRDPNAAARAAAEQHREWVQELRNRPESVLDGYETPAGDRWFFEDEERRRAFLDAVRESVRQGRRHSRGRQSTFGCRGASASRTSRQRSIYGTAPRIQSSTGGTSTSSSKRCLTLGLPSGMTRATKE